MLFYRKSLKNGVKKPGRRSPVGPKAPMCSVCWQTCQPAKLGSGAGHAVGLRIRAAGEDHVFSVAPDGHARGRAVGVGLFQHAQRRLPGVDRLRWVRAHQKRGQLFDGLPVGDVQHCTVGAVFRRNGEEQTANAVVKHRFAFRGGEGILLLVSLCLVIDGRRGGRGRYPAAVERGAGAARRVSARCEPERCAEDERETRRHH